MIEGHRVIPIIQGEFRVSDAPDVVLSTILGSCVAACLYDVGRGVGGMNHFLLPGNDPSEGNNIKYGAHSMERLINALLRKGARKHRLQASLFGGANVVQGLSRIGSANVEFAKRFVAEEGFPVYNHDLGGSRGRRLKFHPPSGRFQLEYLKDARGLDALPRKPARPTIHPKAGDVSLF